MTISMEACQPSLNDGTTVQHVPEPRCSCFCVFFRLGLILIVLFKMAWNLGFLALIFLALRVAMHAPKAVFCMVLLGADGILNVVDIVFGMVLIINICVQCQRIMELYYKCSIYIFISLTVLSCIIMFIIIPVVGPFLYFFFIFLFILLMQLYINYVVKSEFPKLRSNEEIQL